MDEKTKTALRNLEKEINRLTKRNEALRHAAECFSVLDQEKVNSGKYYFSKGYVRKGTNAVLSVYGTKNQREKIGQTLAKILNVLDDFDSEHFC